MQGDNILKIYSGSYNRRPDWKLGQKHWLGFGLGINHEKLTGNQSSDWETF